MDKPRSKNKIALFFIQLATMALCMGSSCGLGEDGTVPATKAVGPEEFVVRMKPSLGFRPAQYETVRVLGVRAIFSDEDGGFEGAIQRLDNLVAGKRVVLQYERPGVKSRTANGALLVWVKVDGRDLSELMIESGMARFHSGYDCQSKREALKKLDLEIYGEMEPEKRWSYPGFYDREDGDYEIILEEW